MIDTERLRNRLLDRGHMSLADIKQDIMALVVSKIKRNGYFVEFGALDGITGSNTLLLEKQYGWNGILAEPARRWHDIIKQNRSCLLDYRAVAAESGLKLSFKETNEHLGLSGLVDYFNSQDMHDITRRTSAGDIYEVETISLNDLLNHHNAPDFIDYISIDTEGSELSILEKFDFNRRVGLWTIEHNFISSTRKSINDLMNSVGYIKILEDMSDIDDWYVLNE